MDTNRGKFTVTTEGDDGSGQFPQALPDGKYTYDDFRRRERPNIRRMKLAGRKEEVVFQSDDV